MVYREYRFIFARHGPKAIKEENQIHAHLLGAPFYDFRKQPDATQLVPGTLRLARKDILWNCFGDAIQNDLSPWHGLRQGTVLP